MSLLKRHTTEQPVNEEQEPSKKVELEKGDLAAILIAAFFNFILPTMLALTGICLLAYFFFTRLK